MKADETNTPYDIHHSLEQVVLSLQKIWDSVLFD